MTNSKLPFFSSIIIGSAFKIYVNLSVDVVVSLKQCVSSVEVCWVHVMINVNQSGT